MFFTIIPNQDIKMHDGKNNFDILLKKGEKYFFAKTQNPFGFLNIWFVLVGTKAGCSEICWNQLVEEKIIAIQ